MAAISRELVGRTSEQAQLAAMLEAARHGTSGGLVLEGEPGIGKSALLEDTIVRAAGFRLLRAQGLQSEVELPYGGVGQLLRPLADLTSSLSATHSQVLQTVFYATGMRSDAPESAVSDRFAVGAAALALLAAAAETGPVFAVLDDVQWVDQPSVEALVFVAHRLLVEGIVLIASRRTGEGSPALNRLPSLNVSGLDENAARSLIGTSVQLKINSAHMSRLVGATKGNPLALIELPRLLSSEQLADVLTLEQPLPVSQSLVEAYSSKFNALPDRCRLAVLIAATLTEPEVRTVQVALAAEQLTMNDLVAAEDLGLVMVRPDQVTFHHPLVRSAATYATPPSWRRRAHAAAAASLREQTAQNKRFQCVWHTAEATLGVDETIAESLEREAESAIARLGFAAGSVAYERASALSPASADQRRRLVHAARLALLAGRVATADELLRRAAELVAGAALDLRLEAQVRSQVDLAQGKLEEALSGTRSAAEQLAPDYPLEAAHLLVEAAAAAAYLGRVAIAREVDARALQLAAGDAETTAIAGAALGAADLVMGDSEAGLPVVLPMIPLLKLMIPERPESLPSCTRIALALTASDHFDSADDLLSLVLDEAETRGAVTAIPLALLAGAHIANRRGQWQRARTMIFRCLNLASDTGQELEHGSALSQIAELEACAGAVESSRERAGEALNILRRIGAVISEAWVPRTLGFLELSLRNLEASIEFLQDSRKMCERYGLLELGYWQWAPELSEAYTRAGRVADAMEVVGQLDWHADRTDRPIIKAFAARCRGFAMDTHYVSHFEAALRWHEVSERPFELARTQLCYGERLRRDRKRAAARQQLERAWVAFESLGAKIWAEIAQAELAAVGVVVNPNESSDKLALLTPQELQVAMAITGGATNREAAAQLFLSPKTIEYHLARIYRKLDVSSRNDLMGAM